MRCPANDKAAVASRIKQVETESYGMLSPFNPKEPMLHQPFEALKEDKDSWVSYFLTEHQKGSPVAGTTAILHANLAPNFIFYYEMAHDFPSKSIDNAREFARKLSGIDDSILNGLSKDELKDICIKVLDMKLHSENQHESASALILKMALAHPSLFPVSEEVSQKLTQLLNNPAHSNIPAREMIYDMLLGRKIYYSQPPSVKAAAAERSLNIPVPPPEAARTPQEIDGICVQLAFHPFRKASTVRLEPLL